MRFVNGAGVVRFKPRASQIGLKCCQQLTTDTEFLRKELCYVSAVMLRWAVPISYTLWENTACTIY